MEDRYLVEEQCYNRLLDEWKKFGSIIIAVKFDDTIYDINQRSASYPAVIDLVKKCKSLGAKIVIWTDRPESDYTLIEEHCIFKDIIIDGINKDIKKLYSSECRKIYYDILLDDRAGLYSAVTLLTKVAGEMQRINNILDGES